MPRPPAPQDMRWRRRRGRVVPAIGALLLSVGGVIEFGVEDPIAWIAVIFWLLAVAAVGVATSAAAPWSSRDLGS